MKAKGTYSVKKWEENAGEKTASEQKITKASVEYAISGEINGKAIVEYLMYYKYFDPNDQHKSSATYIGLMGFTGSILGKEGSLVIEDHGTFENGSAKSTLQIITGSGTEELKGMEGTGYYSADQNGFQIELDYIL